MNNTGSTLFQLVDTVQPPIFYDSKNGSGIFLASLYTECSFSESKAAGA